jgi:hypothetical protein
VSRAEAALTAALPRDFFAELASHASSSVVGDCNNQMMWNGSVKTREWQWSNIMADSHEARASV